MEVYDKEARSVEVGGRIRELREERGLSMRALAREAGISANALSMIERSKTSPSVSTLYKLTNALDIPITALFHEGTVGSDVVFIKAMERTRVPFPRGLWEGLGGEEFLGQVEPFMLTLESGASSGPFNMVHDGHEFVMCLRGQLEYQVGNKAYRLEAGDTLLFSAHLKHRWRNPGNTVTNAMFVLFGCEEAELHVGGHFTSSNEEELIELEDSESEDLEI